MICYEKHVRFPVVQDGIKDAKIQLSQSLFASMLIWSDSLREPILWAKIRPWQIINRIPRAHTLCNKATLARAFRQLPSEALAFWPKTFILPDEQEIFATEHSRENNTFIIKPAEGSLGRNVKVLRPGKRIHPDTEPAIAQVYICSFLYNSRKFDLRIYVLVASISPLEIYVYRDGVSRICFLSAGGSSRFSCLTNVAVNKISQSTDILQVLSDFLPALGISIEQLWVDIDRIAILTILSVYKEFLEGERLDCPSIGYSRCFQLFGFDILIDERLKVWLLEVNYRPSLTFIKPNERRMKTELVRDVMLMFSGYKWIQEAILARKCGWSKTSWRDFIRANEDRVKESKRMNSEMVEFTSFERVWPSQRPDFAVFQQIIDDCLQQTSSS